MKVEGRAYARPFQLRRLYPTEVYIRCPSGRPLWSAGASRASLSYTSGCDDAPGAASTICVTTAAGREMTLADRRKMQSHSDLRRQFAARQGPLVVRLCHKPICGPVVASRWLAKGFDLSIFRCETARRRTL